MVGLCGVEQLKLQLVALRAAGAYCRGCRPCAAAVGEPLAEACTVPPLAAHQHCTALHRHYCHCHQHQHCSARHSTSSLLCAKQGFLFTCVSSLAKMAK